MNVFLTSKAFLYDQDVFEQFLSWVEINRFSKKMISITTAQRNKEERKRYENQFKELLMRSGFEEIEFIDIEFENPELLRKFPLICIQGGDPFYLLDQIKKSKTDSILIDLYNEGRILIGHSSGAAVMGSTISHANLLHPEWNTIDMIDFKAVGIIDEIILPHGNRYIDKQEEIRTYEEDIGKDLLKIVDGQYIIL